MGGTAFHSTDVDPFTDVSASRWRMPSISGAIDDDDSAPSAPIMRRCAELGVGGGGVGVVGGPPSNLPMRRNFLWRAATRSLGAIEHRSASELSTKWRMTAIVWSQLVHDSCGCSQMISSITPSFLRSSA